MSVSGLIYVVIVGAWAAYLLPMFLRRGESDGTDKTDENIESEHEEGAPAVAGPADVSTDPVDEESEPEPETVPVDHSEPHAESLPPADQAVPSRRAGDERGRSRMFSRRRRTVLALTLTTLVGVAVTGYAGPVWSWLPGFTGLLLVGYLLWIRTSRPAVPLARPQAAPARTRRPVAPVSVPAPAPQVQLAPEPPAPARPAPQEARVQLFDQYAEDIPRAANE